MPLSQKRTAAAENVSNTKKTVKLNGAGSKMSEILRNPVKSESDKKEYRQIKLSNGLTSLLVQHFIEDADHEDEKMSQSEESCESDSEEGSSDGEADNPKEKLAAVALCIDVGSWYDPKDIQGLSHFLEHMIFMGSEKFPKENEFDEFVSTNGGSDNALTECEYTMFYFDIVEEHLAGAIERFAQLFVSPLMLKDSMEREMQAVESEFQNNLNDDDTRIMQLCASIANGPISTFTWGNLKTLKEGISNDKLYSAVHDFRRKHYLANRMHLCVESSLSLDDLQKLVETNFAAIQSGPDPPSLEKPEHPFQPEFFEKVFYVKPKADKSKLFVTFLLPSMEKHYKSKPHDYLSYVIQHEGAGSLSSFLKKRLLALRIESGAEDQSFEGNSMFTLFSINVTLTEEGYNKLEEVLEAIFSFLLLLKSTSIEDHEKCFMELKQIRDTSFKYREEKTSTDNVEELAVNMKYYEPQDILTGPDIFLEFDAKIVGEMIKELNERKFNILLLTDKREKYEKTEKWFGTEYDEIDFPQSYLELWNNRKLNPEFTLPLQNDFICSDFKLFADDPSNLPEFPEKVFSDNVCECFYKLDGTFKLPHAFICLYLVSPKTVSSVRYMVLTSLYSMIVKHYMSEKLYPAVCAGLGYQLFSEEKGMLLKLSGYNEKLPLLLDIITNDLHAISSQIEPSVFDTYRKQFKKYVYNNLINSKFLNKDCRLNIVEEHHKFFFYRYVEAEEVTFDELVQFASEFLKELKVQILVQGNIQRETALEVTKCVMNNLKCREINGESKIESRAVKLPVGENIFRLKSVLPNDKNSTTTTYIQIGSSSIRLQCLVEFIEKIMEEPLFDILRTQEQLGYSVSCSHRFNHGILGISVTVQSQEDKNPTTAVEKRIEKFLHENLTSILDKMTDEEFETVQTALIKLKNMVEVELESEVSRHWSEITSREYIFNRLQLEAQMIAQLTKSDVVEFYKEHVIGPNVRKLLIQVVGVGADEKESEVEENYEPEMQVLLNGPGKLIADMEEFKNSLELHPVTKTVIDL